VTNQCDERDLPMGANALVCVFGEHLN
jgi:hypothetical protein